MNEFEFKKRTKQVALRVIRLCQALPKNREADVLAKQLLRSGTSIGANYRAACRAKSKADMVSKLGIVEEEADESLYWLELIVESEFMTDTRVSELYKDIESILAMTVASEITIRKGLSNLKPKT